MCTSDVLDEAREGVRLYQAVDLSLRLVEDGAVEGAPVAVEIGLAFRFFLR